MYNIVIYTCYYHKSSSANEVYFYPTVGMDLWRPCYLAAGLDRLHRQRQRQPRQDHEEGGGQDGPQRHGGRLQREEDGEGGAVGAGPAREEEGGQHVPFTDVEPASGGERGRHKKSCKKN